MSALVRHANYVAYSYVDKDGLRKLDDKGRFNDVEGDLRKLAGDVYVISNYSLYKFWSCIRFIPSYKQLLSIQGDLIGWANTLIEKDFVYNPDRDLLIESLKMHLGLDNQYQIMRERSELRNSKN